MRTRSARLAKFDQEFRRIEENAKLALLVSGAPQQLALLVLAHLLAALLDHAAHVRPRRPDLGGRMNSVSRRQSQPDGAR